LRNDVVIVTVPLLGAGWYRDELMRRHKLISRQLPDLSPLDVFMRDVGESARAQGRPIAVAVTVPAAERATLGANWVLAGFHYRPASEAELTRSPSPDPQLDVTALEAAASLGERGLSARVRPNVDPIAAQMARLLDCPALALEWMRGTGSRDVLDSSCNFR
jgi:hypothetical protein